MQNSDKAASQSVTCHRVDPTHKYLAQVESAASRGSEVKEAGRPVAEAALKTVAEQALSLHIFPPYRKAFGARTVNMICPVTRVSNTVHTVHTVSICMR